VGVKNIGKIIKGASNEGDALKKFKADSDSFQRPVVSTSRADRRLPEIDVFFRRWIGAMVKQVRNRRGVALILLH